MRRKGNIRQMWRGIKKICVPCKPTRTQGKRSWRNRTQDKRLLLSQKHKTSYLSWIRICWQYYTSITVPSWADHVSRPDGMVLSYLPLEGHFCFNYSHSILFYASLLYRLLWKLRKAHCSFSYLIGRRSLYFHFLLGLSCFSSLWIADLLMWPLLWSLHYTPGLDRIQPRSKWAFVRNIYAKTEQDEASDVSESLPWMRKGCATLNYSDIGCHLGWSRKQMLDWCSLQRSCEERSHFSKVLAD